MYAFRARSRATVHRMAAGESLGVETSIDKVLLASSEQAVFDLVGDVLPAAVTIGDDVDSARWRSEFLYSRAASIYGGSSRDPAQHHRPPSARPRERPMSESMLEGEDLELFARSLRAATEQHTGDALDAAVAELGWDDALSFDTRAAVSTLFEAQGEACARSSALDRVVAFALGRELDGDTAVVLPPIGSVDAPATGWDGAWTRDRQRARRTWSSGRSSTRARSRPRAVHGIDPDLGLVEVSGEVDVVDAEPVDWSAAVQLAQVALAHELIGVSRRALAMAREHALERIQFDQPIAKFQAVRHRLADTLVAIETAVAVVDAAWLDPTPVTAAMAKATAGRSARVAAKHCQQVLAGIGFTTEHDLHRYLRRIVDARPALRLERRPHQAARPGPPRVTRAPPAAPALEPIWRG